MAHAQRPFHGQQQYAGERQDVLAGHSAQWHSPSNPISDIAPSQYPHQIGQYDHRQQTKHYDDCSWAAAAQDRNMNEAPWIQRQGASNQPAQREAEVLQRQGRWTTETREGQQNWHDQEQYYGNSSLEGQRTPRHANLHTDSFRQDQLRHRQVFPPYFQRSHSHEAAPGVGHAQALINRLGGYADVGSRETKLSNDDQSRHRQPRGKVVKTVSEYSGKTPKKHAPEKERIIIEPSSPDTISWDNPFPTFPTNKKKAETTDYASVKSLPSRGTQDQRPRTANSERTSNSTSQQMELQSEPKVNGPTLQENELFNEKATGGFFKQKTNGNFSLPSSPVTANFSQKAYRTPTTSDRFQEHAFYDERMKATQAYVPNVSSQGDDPRAISSSAHTSTQGPNVTLEIEERSQSNRLYSSSTRAYPSHISQTNIERHDIYNSSNQTHQRKSYDAIPSYYADQATSRQELNGVDFDQQSPLDEDMPDFSVLSIADAHGGTRPSEDLHLQPSSSVPSNPKAITPQTDRGRRANQEPKIGFAILAQRSRSQPGHRDVSLPTKAQVRNFDFSSTENPHNQNSIVGRIPRPPLPYSHSLQRGLAEEAGFSARSTAGLTYGHPNHTQKIDPGMHPIVSGNPSPMDRPTIETDQNTDHSARTQSPYNQKLTNLSEDTRAGLASGGYDKAVQSSHCSPNVFSNHAIPVRPGLSNQKRRPPPPIRQYGEGTSFHNQVVSPPPQSSDAPQHGRSPSYLLAQADIGRLRQAVQANPNDMNAQLTLAKKMVEMSSILADQEGRADPKQRAKNREKYILDAHRMVKKLVNSNHAEAMFYLADCYGRGLLGLETDPKEAFNLYLSAAKLGHVGSTYRVAVCCEMGQDEGGGTRRDPLKAVQWYKRAAILGDTPAMYKMGMIQLKGLLGQPRNPREAIVWLKRAAERADEENPHALHELVRELLGLLFESAGKNDNIIRDEAYSLQLFTQAATLGYKFSQHRLGAAYEYGSLGCVIDARQSIAWYSKAAVQEEHQSELALSGWYLTGSEGVLQQSDTEAYLWARKAAHAGLAKAEYAMGYFTEVGIGAPASLEDAKRWYWKAASQNFPKARERLEDLRKGGARMEKSRVSRSAVSKGSDGDCSLM